MKITLTFSSHESGDLSYGGCFVPSFCWFIGSTLLYNIHPEYPHYKEGDLEYLISNSKIKNRLDNSTNLLHIIIHNHTGHGTVDDIVRLFNEAKKLGFNPLIHSDKYDKLLKKLTDESSKNKSKKELSFGSKLNHIIKKRKTHDATQKINFSSISKELNLSPSTISKIISNKIRPKHSTYLKIKNCLNLNEKDTKSLDELYYKEKI